MERFLKSAVHVTDVNHVGASSALKLLGKDVDMVTGAVFYPAMKAITDVFRGLRQMQNEMESAHYPMIHMEIKMLKDICREQLLFQEDKPVGNDIWIPNEHRKRIARKVLQQMGAVEIHGV